MAFTIVTDYDAPPYNVELQNEQNNSFTSFIQRNEDELLLMVLGAELYDDFKAGIAVGSPDQKWIDLRDGKNYVSTQDGKTYKYTGIKPFIIPYVFAMWNHDAAINKTSMGTALAVAENSEGVSPATLICNAYNASSRLIGNEWEHIKTLFGFLSANKDVYINWLFEEIGLMNQFNI